MLKSNSPDLQSYDVFGQGAQGAHGDAGAALRVVMAVFGRGAGAGDVEVGPAGFVDEFTDDEGAGDGAAFPTPGVFNVRDVALVLLLVLGIFGQAAIPHAGRRRKWPYLLLLRKELRQALPTAGLFTLSIVAWHAFLYTRIGR